ncbi:hypothetical protein [Treponema primitia]|uniref:hypothetical protein n=1 Tax=Treponema primitia TaxID=88058 RepID=UPI0002555761|nr:hypothetical protein [Treponema primitia]
MMSDDSDNKNYWAAEVRILKKEKLKNFFRNIFAKPQIKNKWNEHAQKNNKIFKTHLIEMSETSKVDLEAIYRDYLTGTIDLASAQKKVLLIEYDFVILLRDYIEIEPVNEFQIEDKRFTDALITGTRDTIDFHKHKLHIDESAECKVIAPESTKDSETKFAGQAALSNVKTEKIPTEIPAVIMDLIKNSGMVEAERDIKGRFHPKGTYKDTAIIGWIIDHSKNQKNLTATLYAQYIYTRISQGTLEKYISTARNL